jgi:hypothetical protein
MQSAAVVQVLFMGSLPEFEIDFTEKYLKLSRSKQKKDGSRLEVMSSIC